MTIKGAWSFDAGSSHDDSGNGHDGVDTNVSFGAPAVVGKAMQLAGTGGNRSVFPVLNLGGTWTVVGWARPTFAPSPGQNAMIFGDAATGHGVAWKQDRFRFLFASNFDIPGAGGLSINTKYQVAIACHGVSGDVDLYLNGVLDRTISGWGIAFSPDRFGSDLINLDFAGALDEWYTWDRVLTGGEVAALYNGGAGLNFRDPAFPDGPGPLPVLSTPYGRMLRALFPPGRAFDLEIGSTISETTEALAVELQRVDDRGAALVDEFDPRTASETLSDWDRVLGLPDAEVPIIPTDPSEHRRAITAKYIARGGQNYKFFADMIAACGYSLASIDLFAGNGLFRVDDRVGTRCYGAKWAYAFRLNINAPTGAAVDHATLESIVRHKTHSHVIPVFNYL
jgi:uncharacterized protein YmfQ (DUF2313 family)